MTLNCKIKIRRKSKYLNIIKIIFNIYSFHFTELNLINNKSIKIEGYIDKLIIINFLFNFYNLSK